MRRRALIGVAGGIVATALPATRAGAAERVRLRDLYGVGGAFSYTAQRLDGESVEIPGFMAPPLKADASFFVLTKIPMAVCPFCDKEIDWPQDIVLVKLRRRQDWVDFNEPIVARGVLALGTDVDADTGFVSRVRLVDAAYATT